VAVGPSPTATFVFSNHLGNIDVLALGGGDEINELLDRPHQ
jgi:hypothetical protein